MGSFPRTVARNSHFKGVQGISLIELLFAVTIIAILVALLFPALGIFREKARTLTCASNLRQIGMGLINYSVDNNGFYPPGDPTGSDNWTWGFHAWKYFGMTDGSFVPKVVSDRTFSDGKTGTVQPNINVFRCPSTAKDRKTVPSSLLLDPETGKLKDGVGYAFSYGLNTTPLSWMYGFGFLADYDEVYPMRRTMIKHLGSTALVMEYGRNTCNPQVWFIMAGLVPHNGGLNVLFHDGHIEWRKLQSIPAYNPNGAFKKSEFDHVFWTGKDPAS
jgi:prepilin-type processing-associated H-X9-DG protein